MDYDGAQTQASSQFPVDGRWWCLAYNNPQVMSEGGGASYDDDDGLMKLLMIGGGTGQVGR